MSPVTLSTFLPSHPLLLLLFFQLAPPDFLFCLSSISPPPDFVNAVFRNTPIRFFLFVRIKASTPSPSCSFLFLSHFSPPWGLLSSLLIPPLEHHNAYTSILSLPPPLTRKLLRSQLCKSQSNVCFPLNSGRPKCSHRAFSVLLYDENRRYYVSMYSLKQLLG